MPRRQFREAVVVVVPTLAKSKPIDQFFRDRSHFTTTTTQVAEAKLHQDGGDE